MFVWWKTVTICQNIFCQMFEESISIIISPCQEFALYSTCVWYLLPLQSLYYTCSDCFIRVFRWWCLKYLDDDVCMWACAWTRMHIVGLNFEVSQNGFIDWTIRICKENLHNDRPCIHCNCYRMCVCLYRHFDCSQYLIMVFLLDQLLQWDVTYDTMQKVNEVHTRLRDTFSYGDSRKHHIVNEKFIKVN